MTKYQKGEKSMIMRCTVALQHELLYSQNKDDLNTRIDALLEKFYIVKSDADGTDLLKDTKMRINAAKRDY